MALTAEMPFQRPIIAFWMTTYTSMSEDRNRVFFSRRIRFLFGHMALAVSSSITFT